ncbi:MAG: hypothetical protein AAGB48_12335 [Planctomycetota bacterium]
MSRWPDCTRFVRLVVTVACLPLLVGCGGGLKKGQERFLAGDFQGARALLASAAQDNRSGADAVIVWLEYASVLHHLGEFAASTEAFATAEAQIESIDNAPAVSVGNQARLLLTNPEESTYRASGVDRVMAPTLRGLANILAGRTERARQSFVAAQFAREIAQDKRAEEIARARDASQAAASERQSQAQQTFESDETRQRLEQQYARLEQFGPYADYSVPFSDWLEAVYLLGVQQDNADADRAVTLLNRVRGMVEGHGHLEQDAASAQEASRGVRLTGVTYVVFASGLAPLRREQRIDLPLFIVTDTVDYIGVALPVLAFNDAAELGLVVEAGGVTAETSLLTDMDRVVASEFNAVKGALIRQSITSAVVKAGAAYGINKSVEGQDPVIEAVVRLITISYQVVMNKTDTRCWVSLPKLVATARVPTPASGEIALRRPGGETQIVRVDPDAVSIVYARSLGPGRPMTVDWAPLYPPGVRPSAGTQPDTVGGQQGSESEQLGSGSMGGGPGRSN